MGVTTLKKKPNFIDKVGSFFGDLFSKDQDEIVSPLAAPTPTLAPRSPRGLQTGDVLRLSDLEKIEEAPVPTPSLIDNNEFDVPPSLPDDSVEPDSGKGIFVGLNQNLPNEEYTNLISTATSENDIHPSLIAAMLWQESGYRPEAINDGGKDGIDRGIAQINSKWHPEVSDEQAFDPNFAIPWMVRQLKSDIDHFGDISKGIAAYNIGRTGATAKGDTEFGGTSEGQKYIDDVSKNLTNDLKKELGLKTS